MLSKHLVIALSFFVLLSLGARTTSSSSSSSVASSSSAVASSSSSKAASSSSAVATGLVLGSDCKSKNVVGADPCEAVNKDWCCYYTSSQIGDGVKTEAYTCTTNPSVYESLLNGASSLLSSATTDSSNEAKVEAYCANAMFAAISSFVLVFAAVTVTI